MLEARFELAYPKAPVLGRLCLPVAPLGLMAEEGFEPSRRSTGPSDLRVCQDSTTRPHEGGGSRTHKPLILNQRGLPVASLPLVGVTGIEPATSCSQGTRAPAALHPELVGRAGLEPAKAIGARSTISWNCHYPTCPNGDPLQESRTVKGSWRRDRRLQTRIKRLQRQAWK